MQVLSAAETRDRLPYTALADAIRDVLLSRAQTQAPARTALPLANDGTLLLMPAADAQIAMTKMVTVHPHNARQNRATIQGEMIVLDARTGVRHGLLDGGTVSARRTAALSLLAARELAPVAGGPVVIVGAGTQARAHLEAFHEGLGCKQFFICSRTRERAVELAADAAERGLQAEVVDRVADAPADARLYVTATTSRAPVLPDHLPEDAFVAAVGAFKPDMAELPPELIRRSRVVVDTLDGAREEAGDLIDAAKAGAFDWGDAVTLAQAVGGGDHDNSSSPNGPVLFKSVGHSLWDLAAARLAFAHD